MQKVTFVVPSRNNLEFLQLCYAGIRKLNTVHEILVLDDASTDGTGEWLKSLNDESVQVYTNPGPERIGIVGMFDKGIEMAKTDIICAYHADMVAGPDLDKHLLKHVKLGTVVTATRIEPPLHPPGPEKVVRNFGIEVTDFDMDEWLAWPNPSPEGKVTEGIFAPWCMYKSDFEAIGGHDELFAPQSKEDSDLFNRMHLAGYKFVQTWDGIVYHFTSRGSRFNKHSGGGAGQNSEEWIYTTTKNGRNFIRKWGQFIEHDEYLKPVVTPKYNIGCYISNCTPDLLRAFEPWFDNIFVDVEYSQYVESEQLNTIYDMSRRVHSIHADSADDVVVRLDASKATHQDMDVLMQLPKILAEQLTSTGEYKVGCLEIEVNTCKTYEENLICSTS